MKERNATYMHKIAFNVGRKKALKSILRQIKKEAKQGRYCTSIRAEFFGERYAIEYLQAMGYCVKEYCNTYGPRFYSINW